MKKKVLISTLLIIVLGILFYNYKENYVKISKVPCSDWAKEVYLYEGNINKKPSIIKYKGYYYIACNDGDVLKVLKVDKLGEKKKEYVVNMKYKNFNDIGLVQNKNNICLTFTTPSKKNLKVVMLELDNNMNILNESVIDNVTCKSEIGDNILLIGFNNAIEVRDLYNEKKYRSRIEGKPTLITGTIYKDTNYIMYSIDDAVLEYITLKNDKISKKTEIERMYAIIRIHFKGLALSVNENKLCSVVEAENAKEGTVFSIVNKLDLKTKEIYRYVPEELNINFSSQDIVSATYDGEIKFLVSADREYEKTEIRNDILEICPNGEKTKFKNTLSRTKKLSFYPRVCENMVIFCDAVNAEKSKLYITSKDEEFKKYNNGYRNDEIVEATIKTIEGVLYSILYLIPYGSLWVIPVMSLFCIFSMIEYKLKDKSRKIIFSSVFILGAILKVVIVHEKSFKQLSYYLPTNFKFVYGLIFCIVLSILTSIYGYINYTEDMDYNIMQLSCIKAIFIDAVTTLLLFVPFLK